MRSIHLIKPLGARRHEIKSTILLGLYQPKGQFSLATASWCASVSRDKTIVRSRRGAPQPQFHSLRETNKTGGAKYYTIFARRQLLGCCRPALRDERLFHHSKHAELNSRFGDAANSQLEQWPDQASNPWGKSESSISLSLSLFAAAAKASACRSLFLCSRVRVCASVGSNITRASERLNVFALPGAKCRFQLLRRRMLFSLSAAAQISHFRCNLFRLETFEREAALMESATRVYLSASVDVKFSG